MATILVINQTFVQLLSSKNAHFSQWRGFEPPVKPPSGYGAGAHMRDTANRGTGVGKGQAKRKGKGIVFRPTDD